MTGAEIALILALLELFMKYGVPAGMEIYNQWSGEHPEPTLADIEALKLRVLKPETYFEDKS